MAPQSRANLRHADPPNTLSRNPPDDINAVTNDELFLEPMMGTPLAMYIEKDVEDRDLLVELITKHGGTVSPGYSGVPYILVNPRKESGQSLYRQYAGKKGKIVLDARWVHECVRAGELQTFLTNWAGCKVTGTEIVSRDPPVAAASMSASPTAQNAPRRARQSTRSQVPDYSQQAQQGVQPVQVPPLQASSALAPPPAPPPFSYPVYHNSPHPPARGAMQPSTAAPPQTWQAANGIAPHQTHMAHPHQHHHPHMIPRATNPYGRDDQWNESFHSMTAAPNDAAHMNTLNDGQPPSAGYYDSRFRDDQHGWAAGTQEYYEQTHQQQQYDQTYPPQTSYMPIAGPSSATDQSVVTPSDKPRGRKRARAQPAPAPPASTLVLNRRHPPARSPTPPTRVIKSTYGGNLFTADDVVYLKKYIDYCQEQGLVLSLREICERIAVKAPHHTFYSWRRYCNKHQIRLGGYAMADTEDRSPSPGRGDDAMDDGVEAPQTGPGPGTVAAAQRMMQDEGPRHRSPTPPRALFRSTTGKGVAFTEEDVTFLVKFLAYRKSQGRLDMVSFWKDVAVKAPHHSRASWMKYYRRHKHELNRVEGDEPLPIPPAKKMRYGKNDDILLARYFVNKPEGTSDKIFQDFARIYTHHPWKGWQEHHRIHKAKIDHLIQRLANGETIEVGDDED